MKNITASCITNADPILEQTPVVVHVSVLRIIVNRRSFAAFWRAIGKKGFALEVSRDEVSVFVQIDQHLNSLLRLVKCQVTFAKALNPQFVLG